MPSWVGLLGLALLGVFIGYAFRQSTKVKPSGDRTSVDSWTYGGDSSGSGDHHSGSDGHSGTH